MRVCVEEARLKELEEVGVRDAFGYLEAVDPRCIKSRRVIDFDAIDPFQHEQVPREVLVIDARNNDCGIIFEHLFEAFGVGGKYPTKWAGLALQRKHLPSNVSTGTH